MSTSFRIFTDAGTRLEGLLDGVGAALDLVSCGDEDGLRRLRQVEPRLRAVRSQLDAAQLNLLDDPTCGTASRVLATRRYRALATRADRQERIISALCPPRSAPSASRSADAH